MNRRALLVATVGLGSLAGCLASRESGGDSSGRDTDSSTPPTSAPTRPTITDRTLNATGDCSDTGAASVAFETDSVVVTGCIQGSNGCHQPVLSSATMDGPVLRVAVTTEERGGTDTACTQALVSRGYEATISFGGDPPSKVVVVYEGPGGAETVASAER